MSDIKLKSESYRYYVDTESTDGKIATASVSLFQHKPTMRDYLLVPRSHFYVEINDIERNGGVIKRDVKTQNEGEDEYERIVLYYAVQVWLFKNPYSNRYPYLDTTDLNPSNFYLLYSDSQSGKYVVNFRCNDYLYKKMSQATGLCIETSKGYYYSIFLTEKNIKLYRIANKYFDNSSIHGKYRMNDIEAFLSDRNIANELYTFPDSLRKIMMFQLFILLGMRY